MVMTKGDLLGGRTAQDQGSGDGGLENAQSVEREPEVCLGLSGLPGLGAEY